MAPEKFIFLIGAPKCATTTLAAALAARPDVHQHGRTKEPRFFTDFARTDWQGPGTEHFRRTLVSDRKAYLEGFPLASRDDWALDASTDYLWCPASCDLIRRFAAESEVKVIAVLRDPIERAFSEYTHTIRDGFQDQTFKSSLLAEEARRRDAQHPLFYHTLRGQYCDQISAYRDAFQEDLLVLDYHDVRMNTAAALRHVECFAGMSPLDITEIEERNVGLVPRSQTVTNLVQNEIVRGAARMLVPASLRKRAYSVITSANQVRPEMSDEDARFAYHRMADEIERCVAAPLIPTDNWRTVHKVRADLGLTALQPHS